MLKIQLRHHMNKWHLEKYDRLIILKTVHNITVFTVFNNQIILALVRLLLKALKNPTNFWMVVGLNNIDSTKWQL